MPGSEASGPPHWLQVLCQSTQSVFQKLAEIEQLEATFSG
jgi:hypothetical protein